VIGRWLPGQPPLPNADEDTKVRE